MNLETNGETTLNVIGNSTQRKTAHELCEFGLHGPCDFLEAGALITPLKSLFSTHLPRIFYLRSVTLMLCGPCSTDENSGRKIFSNH